MTLSVGILKRFYFVHSNLVSILLNYDNRFTKTWNNKKLCVQQIWIESSTVCLNKIRQV